jgi:penicillin-binding protein 1C
MAAVGYGLTLPPTLPAYDKVLADWHPSEAWLYDRDRRLIDSERVDFRARRLAWLPLDKISPALIATVLGAEDHRFRYHDGVDWIALGSAMRARLTGGHSRGASTISMQVAAFLAPDLARPGARGWRDKIRQMRAARALEAQWSKNQILAAYLNLAPFRGEAQGIGAAALTLFGKGADALSRQDALLMTALLPDPGAGVDKVATRACRLGAIKDCAALRAAAATMLSTSRSAMLDPGLAPHLAAHLLDRPGLRIRTTLDT